MYPIFLFITVISFIIRWTLNWRIQNKINNTNYSILSRQESFTGYITLFKHMMISEWTFYWSNKEKNNLKKTSNLFSAITILSLLFTIIAFYYLKVSAR